MVTTRPAEAVSRLANEGSDLLRRVAVGKIPSPVSIMEAGIERRTAIVRSFPRSPMAHSELGSYLGMAGKNLRRRDLIDEGITECMIAAELLPGLGPACGGTGDNPGKLRSVR